MRAPTSAAGVALEEVGDEQAGVVLRQGGQCDAARSVVGGGSKRSLVLLQELGPRRRDDEERDLEVPRAQVLDEGEHRLAGPVQVLEDEHGRARARDQLEEARPGGEVLLAGGLRRPRRPSRGRRRWRNHGPSSPSGSTASSFASTVATSSDSRMPACALTISPRAQKVTPSP